MSRIVNSFEDLFGQKSEKDSSSLSLKAVIAIDFGTSRSGFAYALSPADINKENIEDIKKAIDIVGCIEWPGGQALAYIKTLTEILYSPDHQVEAWGYEARTRHAELRQEVKAQDYRYYKNFKMQLHTSQKRTPDGPVITTSDGKEEILVADVIADYLQEIKKVARKDIGQASEGVLNDEEIRWCLTVPAIWTDADKQLMRRAAIKAGLISSSRADEDRLILILEPEAAAIYCQEKEKLSLQPGTCFMVIDCGGGTVDITVHKVVDLAGRLEEVATGTGGAFGSTYIDQTFKEYLESKLSSHAIFQYYENEPIDYLQTMAEWERIKCDFNPDNTERICYFPIRPKLGRILAKSFPELLKELADEQKGDEDSIHLNYQTMINIFTPTLEGAINQVEEQFKNLERQKCDLIYLVGGFSQSPLLQQLIKQKFEKRVKNKIIIPSRPGEAVVKGAVSFGLDPSIIRSRRSRLTYGCRIERPFIANVDPKDKRYYQEYRKEYYCKDCFNMFVLAGESVKVDEKVLDTFYPGSPDQTKVLLTFYATRKNNPQDIRYVDQPHFVKLGEMEVEMPDTTGGLNREIEVAMYFGKTEIKVSAKDKTSGNQCFTTLLFSSTYSPELIGD